MIPFIPEMISGFAGAVDSPFDRALAPDKSLFHSDSIQSFSSFATQAGDHAFVRDEALSPCGNTLP
jgi:hypothetical protein